MRVSELEQRYRESNPEGHYFDRDTLAWFGSVERRAVGIGSGYVIYSERQSRAPEGVPPWRAVLFTADGVLVGSSANGWTRSEAIAGARRVAVAVESGAES